MDGVDDLLSLLNFLKSNGWNATFTEDSVYGLRRDNPHSYPEPLLSLHRSLAESKRCLRALDRIQHRLRRKIRALRRRCMPLIFIDGIKRMPDELLAHIFEMGHNSTRDSLFSVKVSHVSHHFRQVALRKPVLWSRLSIADPLDQINTFMSRFGQVNIEVNLGYWNIVNPSQRHAFLTAVVPLSRRWSSVTPLSKEIVYVITSAGVIQFPNLRHIVCFNMNLNMSWNMPLLSSIHGIDCILNPEMPHLSQLTSITLRFAKEYLDFLGLFKTLRAMKGLRDLSLELDDCRGYSYQPMSRVHAAEVPEPHSFIMETFTINIKDRTEDAVIESLYDALSYLAPSTMAICLGPYINWRVLFHKAKDRLFPYASEIQLLIRQPCDIFQLLSEITRSCDTVRSIYLVTPAATFPSKRPLPSYEPKAGSSLRYLRIENVCLSPEDDVKILAKTFLSTTNGNCSRSLHFVSCKGISENFLQKLQDEVGDGLRWRW